MISGFCRIWVYFNTEGYNKIEFRILFLRIRVIRITELVEHLFCDQQQVSSITING